MKKNLVLLLIIFSLLSTLTVRAEDDECEVKESYELYECRVENICEEYIKDEEIIYTMEDYDEAEGDSWFEEAKELYSTNMNNLYKCALLQVQKNSLELLKTKLINIEKTGELSENIIEKVDTKMKQIDIQFNNLKCRGIDKETIHNKIAVLRQATYEVCRYRSYLSYLREYNAEIGNSIGAENEVEETEGYNILDVVDTLKRKRNMLDEEVEHIYKVFPLVYQAYLEYEDNFTVHIFLELIKEDLIVYRNNLYRTLGPLNQVVYKISNAMSINE